MLDCSVFNTIDGLDDVISPDLKMLDGEDDDLFEQRMERYIQNRFFPAVVRETGQKVIADVVLRLKHEIHVVHKNGFDS